LSTADGPCTTYGELPYDHESKLAAIEKSWQYIIEEATVVLLLSLRCKEAYFYYPVFEGPIAIFKQLTTRLNSNIIWLNQFLNVPDDGMSKKERLKQSSPRVPTTPRRSPSRSRSSSAPTRTDLAGQESFKLELYRNIAASMTLGDIGVFLDLFVQIHTAGTPRKTVLAEFRAVQNPAAEEAPAGDSNPASTTRIISPRFHNALTTAAKNTAAPQDRREIDFADLNTNKVRNEHNSLSPHNS